MKLQPAALPAQCTWRIAVYWAEDKCWFKGTIVEAVASDTEGGGMLHRVLYDDTEDLWHDLSKEMFTVHTEEENLPLQEPNQVEPPAGRKRKRQPPPAGTE